MKTLKNSIIAAVLTIGSLTIAQAQEKARKGWDGSIKGNVTKTSTVTDSTDFVSKKGYQYYKAKSDVAAPSVKLANNKHPDLMKRQIETTPESDNTVNGIADEIKARTIKSKEHSGTVSLLR